MGKPIVISKKEAIAVMEENLKRLKESSDNDTFLLLSYDLVNKKCLGKNRLDCNGGRQLMNESRTFVLYNDKEEFSLPMLSIFSEQQRDIFNILPMGKKHDMIIVPKLE